MVVHHHLPTSTTLIWATLWSRHSFSPFPPDYRHWRWGSQCEALWTASWQREKPKQWISGSKAKLPKKGQNVYKIVKNRRVWVMWFVKGRRHHTYTTLIIRNRIRLLLFENINLWMRLLLYTHGRFPESSRTHLHEFAQFRKARVLAVGDAWISNKRSLRGFGIKYMCEGF